VPSSASLRCPPPRPRLLPVLALTLLAAGCGGAPPAAPSAPPAPGPAAPSPAVAFRALASDFLDFHLYFNPTLSSAAGIRDYDTRMPDLSAAGMEGRAGAYREWLERLRQVDRGALYGDEAVDWRILERSMRLAILEAEEVRPWARNPLHYVRLLEGALTPLVDHRFALESERMALVTERQRQFPALLAEARRNLDSPPPLLTRQAIRELEGTLNFLRRGIVDAFLGVPEGPVRWAFERSNDQAIIEVASFLAFLEEDLLPRSEGSLALGTELTDRLVAAAGVHANSLELMAEVEEEVQRLQRWMEAEAGRLNPRRPAPEVLAELEGEMVGGEALVGLADALQQEAVGFVERRQLLPLPEIPASRMTLVPAGRSGTRAGLYTPGVLAPSDLELRIRLDPVPPGQPGVSRGEVEALALREGIPGALLRHRVMRLLQNRSRILLPGPGEAEAWGLFAAGLLLDQGFRGGDAALRIAHLREHRARLARLHVGIRMHRGELSPEGALPELVRLSGLPEPRARALLERDIHDPLAGVEGILAVRLERLRNDLLSRAPELGGALPGEVAVGVILGTGTGPGFSRLLLLLEEG